MKVLLDTSVLVAALVGSHPQHDPCAQWLRRAKNHEVEGCVSSHTLAELYAVLTALPVRPRVSPAAAQRLIRENLRGGHVQTVALSAEDFWRTVGSCVDLELEGGSVYDVLIARCARKASVDRLVTLNLSDFRRVWPEESEKIVSP